MSRRQDRAHFDVPVRLSLVESDLDTFETELKGLEEAMNLRFDKVDARQGKIMAACVAILTSLVVASIMLAVNLATAR